MAELSRSDAPVENSRNPSGATPASAAPSVPMPETSAPAGRGNSRLEHSAERIGRGVGTAVASVSRLPRQMKSRLAIVGGRKMQSAEAAMEHWQERAKQRVAEWSEEASGASFEAVGRAEAQWEHVRRFAGARIQQLRANALRWGQRVREAPQEWQRERPLQLLAGFAVAGFVLGVVLRIRRANHG